MGYHRFPAQAHALPWDAMKSDLRSQAPTMGDKRIRVLTAQPPIECHVYHSCASALQPLQALVALRAQCTSDDVSQLTRTSGLSLSRC